MTSLYSIQGMHAITGQGNDFYQGRLWPGSKTSANPVTANEQAFNLVFSVFIQEMLHLQMAANMATVLGVSPNFTDTALQDDRHGWTCYGPANSVIPNIIDLKDTIHHEDVPVNVGPLDDTLLRLFIAIEQPEADARANIKIGKEKDYFPQAPFADWKPGQPLPRFGTIGWMYQCYYDYLSLEYTDGSTLLGRDVHAHGRAERPVQQLLLARPPHARVHGLRDHDRHHRQGIAFEQMVSMMDAITDQGEGSEHPAAAPAAAGGQAQVPAVEHRPARRRSQPVTTPGTRSLGRRRGAVRQRPAGPLRAVQEGPGPAAPGDHLAQVAGDQQGAWTAAELQGPTMIRPTRSSCPRRTSWRRR